METQITDRMKCRVIEQMLAASFHRDCLLLVQDYVEECTETWFEHYIHFPLEDDNCVFSELFELYEQLHICSAKWLFENRINDATTFTLLVQNREFVHLRNNEEGVTFECRVSPDTGIQLYANTRKYTHGFSSQTEGILTLGMCGVSNIIY
jgi:hypothetical protein